MGTRKVPTRVKKRGSMRLFAPKYYEKFKCIGKECTKNCCIGWEIDIDPDTVSVYSTLGGEIGDKIRSSISNDGECPHFRLCNGERCANLRDDNLCSIIAECGEDMIPEICREHPRFYNVRSTFCEVGVGIACPTAAELVLSAKDHRVYDIGEIAANGDDFYESEHRACRNFLNAVCDFCDGHSPREVIRFVDHYGIILNNLTLSTPECELDENGPDYTEPIPEYSISEEFNRETVELLREICKKLEMLDSGYDTVIDTALLSIKSFPELAAKTIEDNRAPFLNLLQYFLYRHTPVGVEDGSLYTMVQFSLFSALLILMIARTHGVTIRDAAVDFSRDIEYSDENVYTFIDGIDDTDAAVCARLLLSILK